MVKSPIPFDDGMLLVANGEALLAYNSSAYWIWSRMAEGQSLAEIATALAAEFELGPARATEEVNTILSHWRDMGLLDAAPVTPALVGSLPDIDLAREVQWSASWACRFGGRLVEFAVEDPAAATHLRVALRSVETNGGTPETRIEVRTAGDATMYVRRDGSPPRTASRSVGLKEAAYGALIEFLWPEQTVDTLIHAGSVAFGDTALCFPATSGSGKSTLVAYLCAHGGRYLADDLVAVDRTSCVLPLPLPISIKEGSWPLVDRLFPQLRDSPIERVQSTRARFFTPADAWSARPTRLGALMFSRYASDSDTVVERLRPFDALARLQEAGIWLGHPLVEARVARFATWLEDTPCYWLRYSSLASAAEHVDHVVASVR